MPCTTRRLAIALLATLISATLGETVRAQSDDVMRTEWRKWGGPNGDFIVDSAELAERWPTDGPPELWSRPLGAGHSAILVADGRLFTMYRTAHGPGGGSPFAGEETVIALDANTGDTLWEYTYESKVQDFGQGGAPHATPLLVDDRLFTIGTNKELHVFEPTTGDIIWQRDLVDDFGAPPPPMRSEVTSRLRAGRSM